MDHQFTRLGMRLIDWSVAVSEIVGGPTNVPRLHGFGIHKGTGHLNFDGHRAWATALINVLQPELPRRPDSTPEEPPSDPSHHH
jgi:hypothetical protein